MQHTASRRVNDSHLRLFRELGSFDVANTLPTQPLQNTNSLRQSEQVNWTKLSSQCDCECVALRLTKLSICSCLLLCFSLHLHQIARILTKFAQRHGMSCIGRASTNEARVFGSNIRHSTPIPSKVLSLIQATRYISDRPVASASTLLTTRLNKTCSDLHSDAVHFVAILRDPPPGMPLP